MTVAPGPGLADGGRCVLEVPADRRRLLVGVGVEECGHSLDQRSEHLALKGDDRLCHLDEDAATVAGMRGTADVADRFEPLERGR